MMGWRSNEILQNSSQCLHDKKNPFANVKKGEGCQISGHMLVNKVAGNFHIAFGDSIVRDGMHIHQFVPTEAPGFNVSHTIHSLSFGTKYPNMPQNPLDGSKFRCSCTLFHNVYVYTVLPYVYSQRSGLLALRRRRVCSSTRSVWCQPHT